MRMIFSPVRLLDAVREGRVRGGEPRRTPVPPPLAIVDTMRLFSVRDRPAAVS